MNIEIHRRTSLNLCIQAKTLTRHQSITRLPASKWLRGWRCLQQPEHDMAVFDYRSTLDASLKTHLRAALIGGDVSFVAAVMANATPAVVGEFADEICTLWGPDMGCAQQQAIARQVASTYDKALRYHVRKANT